MSEKEFVDYSNTRVQKRLKIIDLPDDTVPYLGIPITLMLGMLRYYRSRLETSTDATIQEILKEIDLIEIAKIKFDETTCTRVAMLAMKQILESDKPLNEREEWVVHPVEYHAKQQNYRYDLENLHDLNVFLKTRYQLSFLNEILAQRYPGIEYHPAAALGTDVEKSMIYIPKIVVMAVKVGVGAIDPPRTPVDLSEITKPMPLPEKHVSLRPLTQTDQEISGLILQILQREHEIDQFILKRRIADITQKVIEWQEFLNILSALKTCNVIIWEGNTIKVFSKN